MARVRVERGLPSYLCSSYLRDSGVEFESFRHFESVDQPQSHVEFEIKDSVAAVICALKWS